jgi:hypothetical protein
MIAVGCWSVGQHPTAIMVLNGKISYIAEEQIWP